MDGQKITATFAKGRGKNYIALLTGIDPKYKYARTFLNTVAAGNKMNCYEDFQTVDEVAFGSLVEIVTSDYKGKQTKQIGMLTEVGFAKITESELCEALKHTPLSVWADDRQTGRTPLPSMQLITIPDTSNLNL